MNSILKTIIVIIVLLTLNFTLIPLNCSANNLTLGGTITVVSGDQISFTVAWDNSWYASSAPNNWDAVWLFVKYKDCSTTNWLHAPLSTTASDHTVTGGVLQVDAVTDGMGVFVRRTAAGSGNIASATVTLKLNGVATGTYNFKVFGIEMVNIPQNDFQIGDGVSASSFKSITIDNTAQTSGLAAAALYTGSPAIPATFPMGWNSFYCMKYEITQEEYVDFLNTLTYDQQANHTAVAPNVMATNWVMGPDATTTGVSRNGIKIMTAGVSNTTPAVYACDLNNNGTVAGANYNDASDGQNIPCNYLSWADLTAYLDWACLRPMTELEFEKNCRGVSGRIAYEYPWGTIQITQAVAGSFTLCGSGGYNYANYGTSSEASTASGSGLAAYGYTTNCFDGTSTCNKSNTTTFPTGGTHYVAGGGLRVGFAATGTTSRVTAAATYHGVLDMGGNVTEPTIQTNAAGSAFTGVLGDGSLDASGYANVANWPAATGTLIRGGSWYNAASYLQTSTRSYGVASVVRACTEGGRGVR